MKRRMVFVVGFFLLIFAIGFIGGCATSQPNMQAALDELQAARGELQAATSDKGGHRVTAIGIVDQAIAEVNEGIRFANTH